MQNSDENNTKKQDASAACEQPKESDKHGDDSNTEKHDEKRSALFTVKDIETTLLQFTAMTGLYPLVVIAHEIYHGWKGGWETTYLILEKVPIFLGLATTLIICKEGADIMFRRWQEARKISEQERAAIADAARAEGIERGIERGRAEGIERGRAEGRAEVQQWREWYQRQTQAQQKGQPFTEPPPNLNGDTPEE